jgi:hypothetical protein
MVDKCETARILGNRCHLIPSIRRMTTIIKAISALSSVRGYYRVASSAFPIRMGATNSDMFRIDFVDEDNTLGVSLQDFHLAFLTSPLFQFELWILSFATVSDPATTTTEHLAAVTSGDKSSFGPWTAWAVEGKRSAPLTASSEPASACQIMRCYIQGKTFCDTWWAVEKVADRPNPELVFGSAFKFCDDHKPLMFRVLDPLHRLYSRLLLASAMINLIQQKQKCE